MKAYSFILSLCILLCGIHTTTHAQNIEQAIKAKPIKVTGNINAGINYLKDDRLDGYSSPLGYFGSLNLNFSFFNSLNIPVSLLYSDQQASFNRPSFKSFGISPSYKWIQLHLGYKNYALSPYILSGRPVKGIGVELKPGAFHFLAFRGNLTHQYNFGFNDPTFAGVDLEYYDRNTIGGKIGLGNGGNFAHLSFLKAKDDLNTGSLALDTLGLLPEENVAVGLHLGLTKKGIFNLQANVVGSVYTSDQQAPETDVEEGFERLTSTFLAPNESTRHAFAYDASMSFYLGRTTIGVKYQHIDPEYETLGLTYLQPDLDNYTLNLSTSLLRSAININGSVGLQYNNTKSYFENRNKRVIINGNLSWKLSQALNFNGGYNNFNSEGGTNISEVNDSLQITTNSTGYHGNLIYTLGQKNAPFTIGLTVNTNRFDIVNGSSLISSNTSSSYGLSLSKRHKSSGINIGASINYNKFTNVEFDENTRYGVGLNFKKKVSDAFLFSFAPRYNINLLNGIRDGNILIFKAIANYNINSKAGLSINGSYRRRSTSILRPFDQLRLAISFNSRF